MITLFTTAMVLLLALMIAGLYSKNIGGFFIGVCAFTGLVILGALGLIVKYLP